jgi:hypothetical protein
VVIADIENRKDVGMIERCGCAGFLREALEPVTVRRIGNRQNFDCYGAIKASVMGAIHLAHATRTDQ